MTNLYKARKYQKGSAEFEPVEISVIPGELVIISPGSESDGKHLNLREFELKLTGQEGDRIKLDHDGSGISFILSDKAILAELDKMSDGVLSQAATSAQKAIKDAPARKVRYALGALGGVVALLVLAFFSVDFWVDLALRNIPRSAESTIANLAGGSTKLDTSSEMAKRIKRIGDRLIDKLDDNPYKFEFSVEHKDVLNAYAYPGGKIVVLSKLIQDAKSDDELATVLAHEIGHVIHRDSLRHLLHSGGIGFCIVLASGGTITNDQIAVLIPAARALESLNFTRDQERAADRFGVSLAYEAGYNPEAMIDLFKRFEALEPKMGKDALAILSDHPMSEERILLIRKETEEVKREFLRAPPKAVSD